MLQFDGSCGSIPELACVLLRIDFLQRFGQIELEVVQAHFPLLDPAPYLDALVAVLPFFGFGLQLLQSRVGDISARVRAVSRVSL
jgi:hypothetical protein